jgi:hypothetical protein
VTDEESTSWVRDFRAIFPSRLRQAAERIIGRFPDRKGVVTSITLPVWTHMVMEELLDTLVNHRAIVYWSWLQCSAHPTRTGCVVVHFWVQPYRQSCSIGMAMAVTARSIGAHLAHDGQLTFPFDEEML